jgi:DNA-binding helix-turn-helix protein
MKYRVKEIRKEKGMTQVELAEKAKVARGIIVRLESEKEFDTSLNTLQKLACALNCEVSEIFLP